MLLYESSDYLVASLVREVYVWSYLSRQGKPRKKWAAMSAKEQGEILKAYEEGDKDLRQAFLFNKRFADLLLIYGSAGPGPTCRNQFESLSRKDKIAFLEGKKKLPDIKSPRTYQEIYTSSDGEVYLAATKPDGSGNCFVVNIS